MERQKDRGAEREEKRREEGEVEESGVRRVGFSLWESGNLGTPDIPPVMLAPCWFPFLHSFPFACLFPC